MTMSDQVIAVLDNICEKFGIAIDWTSENVLPYVMELAGKFIKYEIATSVVSSVMALAIFFMIFNALKFTCKKWKEDPSSYWDLASVIFGTIFVVWTITVIYIVGKDIFNIVTCLTFPEKAIFECIKRFMQST